MPLSSCFPVSHLDRPAKSRQALSQPWWDRSCCRVPSARGNFPTASSMPDAGPQAAGLGSRNEEQQRRRAAKNHNKGGQMTAGKWLKTACNLCYINCGVEVLVNEGRLEKVRGDRSSPKSQGYLCNKAPRIPYYAHHRDRLTTPLRRRADGGFDAIEWDVAIAEIADRLRDIVDRYGGKTLALYGGGGQGDHAG